MATSVLRRLCLPGAAAGILAIGAMRLSSTLAATEVRAGVTPSELRVSFLGADAARAAIVDDSLEPYFDKLQPLEMAAKTGSPVPGQTLQQMRAECRRRYQAGVLEFTEEEKDALQRCVSELHPVLEKSYPLVASTPWSFIKVSDIIEGGLPHTRGGHIVLSSSVARRFALLGDGDDVLWGMAGLLAHEQLHVVQRAHPDLFAGLYTETWGFLRAPRIERCAWLEEHQVVNPDAVDCGWVFPIREGEGVRYIWPLVVLADTAWAPRMPRDFRTIAVQVERTDDGFRVRVGADGKPLFRDLWQEPDYMRAFAPSTYVFHPNEAAADLFARIVTFEALRDGGAPPRGDLWQPQENLAPLLEWFRKNLRK